MEWMMPIWTHVLPSMSLLTLHHAELFTDNNVTPCYAPNFYRALLLANSRGASLTCDTTAPLSFCWRGYFYTITKYKFSVMEMRSTMSLVRWRPSYSGLNMINLLKKILYLVSPTHQGTFLSWTDRYYNSLWLRILCQLSAHQLSTIVSLIFYNPHHMAYPCNV